MGIGNRGSIFKSEKYIRLYMGLADLRSGFHVDIMQYQQPYKNIFFLNGN